jgi:ABC-type multidrug transport system fused ATPase/permease subunit
MRKALLLPVLLAVFLLCPLPVSALGVAIASENGDNVTLFENVEVTEPVNGNVISVLGNVSVDAHVGGQVVAVFGDIDVHGDVSGQVVTLFGNTTLAKGSTVSGNVITVGSLNKEDGAAVHGQEVRILGESMNLDISALLYLRLAILILFTLAVLVVGLLILALSKEQYRKISEKIEKDFGRKLLLGVLTFLGASILLLLLLVTLIAPLLYIVVLVLSAITASMYFGRIILKTFSQKNSIYTEFITGLATITLVKLLLLFLVPQEELILGFGLLGVVDIFIYCLGLGIHMEERYLKK